MLRFNGGKFYEKDVDVFENVMCYVEWIGSEVMVDFEWVL